MATKLDGGKRPAAAGEGKRPSAPRKRPGNNVLVLRLYVAGTTPRSTRAILDANAFCEAHLAGRYRLEVIDIWQSPSLAREGQIIAVPTLVRQHPLPVKKLVGDLSDAQRVLAGLELLGMP